VPRARPVVAVCAAAASGKPRPHAESPTPPSPSSLGYSQQQQQQQQQRIDWQWAWQQGVTAAGRRAWCARCVAQLRTLRTLSHCATQADHAGCTRPCAAQPPLSSRGIDRPLTTRQQQPGAASTDPDEARRGDRSALPPARSPRASARPIWTTKRPAMARKSASALLHHAASQCCRITCGWAPETVSRWAVMLGSHAELMYWPSSGPDDRLNALDEAATVTIPGRDASCNATPRRRRRHSRAHRTRVLRPAQRPAPDRTRHYAGSSAHRSSARDD
jgi:hypothetical protein